MRTLTHTLKGSEHEWGHNFAPAGFIRARQQRSQTVIADGKENSLAHHSNNREPLG